METMPAVQIHGVDDVRVDQVNVPEPGGGDVLVKVARGGICGSDLGYIAQGGFMPPGVPMPLGHELSGTVERVGRDVKKLAVGQRVTVNPMANGHAIGNGGTEGGFAPLLLVKDVASHPGAIHLLPDSVGFEEGALIEPLAVAMHGINQSGIQAGDTALIMGAGPIGLCALVGMRYRGIDKVVVVDRSAHRLALARELGAQATCRVGDDELAATLKRLHGESEVMGSPVPATDVYLEATGAGPALLQAIELARINATVVVLGVHHAPIELHPLTLLIKELRLVGSMAYPGEYPEVIQMLESGAVDVAPLVSHSFPLEEFLDALDTARDQERAGKVMIEC